MSEDLEQRLRGLETILASKPRRARKPKPEPKRVADLEATVTEQEGTVSVEFEIQQEGGET